MNISGYELYGRIVAHYTAKKEQIRAECGRYLEFEPSHIPEKNQFYVMTRDLNNKLVFVKFNGDETFIFDNFKDGNSSVETIVTILGELA